MDRAEGYQGSSSLRHGAGLTSPAHTLSPSSSLLYVKALRSFLLHV